MASIKENFYNEISEDIKNAALNKLKEIDYWSVFQSVSKFTTDNLVGKYLPIFITLILALGMYLLGFISDCFGCGPFRALILFIYIFSISCYMLIQTTKANCEDKLRFYNELKLAGICTAIFAGSYILLTFLTLFVPGLNIISRIGPGKVLIPTFLGLIPYYFYYIYAEQQVLQLTCFDKKFNIFGPFTF